MCEWVMSHVQMSHVSCVNESCLTCAWVMSRVWMSHVSYVNESCLICEWVKSHMWMSHVSHVSESCLTCKWVMSHMCMCQVSHVNESCLTCKWVMSHMWVSHVSHVNASSRMHTWNADQSESDQEDAVKTNLMTSATSLENLLSTGFFWRVPFSLTHSMSFYKSRERFFGFVPFSLTHSWHIVRYLRRVGRDFFGQSRCQKCIFKLKSFEFLVSRRSLFLCGLPRIRLWDLRLGFCSSIHERWQLRT